MHTLTELIHEMLRLSRLLEAGLDELRSAAAENAHADSEYKLRYSTALLQAEGKTVSDREAQAHIATGDARLRHKLAEGLLMAAQESVRSRRQQISACQSIANAARAEAEFARTGPSNL